jgi:hypothetical protein
VRHLTCRPILSSAGWALSGAPASLESSRCASGPRTVGWTPRQRATVRSSASPCRERTRPQPGCRRSLGPKTRCDKPAERTQMPHANPVIDAKLYHSRTTKKRRPSLHSLVKSDSGPSPHPGSVQSHLVPTCKVPELRKGEDSICLNTMSENSRLDATTTPRRPFIRVLVKKFERSLAIGSQLNLK